ncbi:hypothetical protein U3516DRAFT_748072 [Neocallimastix sp. 'constans']
MTKSENSKTTSGSSKTSTTNTVKTINTSSITMNDVFVEAKFPNILPNIINKFHIQNS